MSDSIGRIAVPSSTASGLTFPLTSDFGYGVIRPWPTITHRFGDFAEKAYQTFQVGIGPRKFPFKRSAMNQANRKALFDFFEQVQGSFQTFTYRAPQPDKTTTNYEVIFETQPLTVQELANACTAGFNFIEIPDPASAPSYAVNSTCLRFPNSTLEAALLSQVQQIIPLVHIKVREAGVPEIYLSDRRVTIGGQLYLPRVLNLGEPGSDAIMSQDISGAADNVQFTFGNADRVMTKLANDTDLKFATIDLSLFHVNSGILLQLWKGFIIDFQSDGGPEFPVHATDGLYQLTQQYPNRTISRQCWKTFNDGVNCPWASQTGSTVDSANFPSASTSICDYYFDSPNGCQAHKMAPFNDKVQSPERQGFFGGHPAQPQGVLLKDNSTGIFGLGRNMVTATSIISDTMWGQALPEIWCNDDGDPGKAFYANAIIAAGRDEGDFFDLLGIVGDGPIGDYTGWTVYTNADGYKYIIAPMADGFPPQGFKIDSQLNVKSSADLGIREVPGSDPAPIFYTDDFGNHMSPSFSLGQGSPQVWGPETAAGTAFVELRYAKPSGFSPSSTDQHSMQIPISKGLSGFTWDADGNRSTTAGLTNPFWVAINSYLRALGLSAADSATQQGTFVLSSLIVGDGSGTAEIADDVVTKIFGAGTEKQFRFQGTIAQQKPFRDWLTEILSCCLGYFTFEFGKLKLGARINASAVEAFTVGNILYQSLQLKPIGASFEHLIIDFADQAYQYQANTAEYQDKDHAAYYGRSGSPLTARLHSVGCGTLSQALRLATVRTREEIGGIDAAEWKNARSASWKTTILALNTEVGQVVSMTHPDVPGGTGNFRIQKWTLRKDWSIDIQAKTVTASMYDVTVGPKPLDVTPAPLPVLNYAVPASPAWAPYQVRADDNDALWPGEFNFELSQSYATLADGSASAKATAAGKLPVNSFIDGCGAPVITAGGISQSTTGGNIAGGKTLRVAVCALNAAGQLSPPSAVILVQIPAGTNTNQFTITGIHWPPVTGLTQYALFLSDQDDLICEQALATLASTGDGTTYTPTSITITGPFVRSTWALPDSEITSVRVKGKHLVHGGVIGALVDSVSTNTIVASEAIDGSGTDNWTGRVLAIIGRNNNSAPWISFNITAFSPATGIFTLSHDPVALGVEAGDVFVVCFKGYDNSADPSTITDAGLANGTNSHAGETPHDSNRKGNIIRVIKGTSRGQMRKITDNTATSYSLDAPLVLAADSVYIVESPTWEYSVDSSPVNNANFSLATQISLPTENLLKQPILVGGFTVDKSGIESEDGDAPIRMLFIFGAGGASGLATPGNVTLGTPIFRNAGQDAQGKTLVEIFVAYIPPADPGDVADHVHAYLQAPDDAPASSTQTKAIIGTVGGLIVSDNPAEASNILPVVQPIDEGIFPFTADHMIHFTAPYPPSQQTWRIYAVSGSPAIENPLVRFGMPDATPSVTITINPPTIGVDGAEYAPNGSNVVGCPNATLF